MTGKTIKFGNDVLELLDPQNVQPVSADFITESRVYSGNLVCLSFASVVWDGENKPEARISSRIRLTLIGAMDLRNALNDLLKEAMPGKDKAN